MANIKNIEVDVTVVLGTTSMKVSDVAALTNGSVVALEQLAGAALEIRANGTLIGYGEVVITDERYGVRIVETVKR